ncbi:hypothetical protein PC123_g24375 [Phytophthora cactorum]|nr:hypothetical protein PC123_g24375 [Phytophthora cactorum]
MVRPNGDASGQQQRPARLIGDRHPALAGCSLAPSFPQAQTPFQTLSAMPNPVLLRASTASNALSAADSADIGQPWMSLTEMRATPITSLEQFTRLSRGEEASYTTRKRGIEEVPRPQSTSGEEGKSCSVATVEKPKRKRKYRKATHTIRKEEKERLEKEVKALKAQIADLRCQMIAPLDETEELIKRKYEARRVLRESVQQRQKMFSQLSSIMSEYTLCTIQSGSPLEDFIHLKTDEQARRDTLAAIKIKKMEKAQRFMDMRRPNLDPCNIMGEERRYEAENGDFCSTRFTVTQFEDAQSVKQVFDLLLFYFCNIEISISEKIGHITIREDDGGDDKGIVQNRLVSTTHKDVKMESNTVLFSQYYDRSTDKSNGPGDSSYGIIVADFVDEDDRHPYVPSQRVRRDVNAVLEIREFVPRRPKNEAGASPRKSVVVLSRWVQNRMHYPKFLVCTDGWYELRDNMDLWGRALHRTIAENLRGRP